MSCLFDTNTSARTHRAEIPDSYRRFLNILCAASVRAGAQMEGQMRGTRLRVQLRFNIYDIGCVGNTTTRFSCTNPRAQAQTRTHIMRMRYSAEIPPQRLHAIITIHLFWRSPSSSQVQDEPTASAGSAASEKLRPKNTLARKICSLAYAAAFGRWLTDVELMMCAVALKSRRRRVIRNAYYNLISGSAVCVRLRKMCPLHGSVRSPADMQMTLTFC